MSCTANHMNTWGLIWLMGVLTVVYAMGVFSGRRSALLDRSAQKGERG